MKKKTPAFSAGILAGGKSTRMGQNKALMEFQNETMIGRISRQFSDCGEVLVSASQRGLYEAEGLRVVYDEADSIGPIEGIRQLLSHAGEEYVFICAADMPFVNREIAEYLAEFISSDYDCYVVTDEEHVHPLCAIYSKRVLPVIEELIREKRYKLIEILDRVRTKYVSLKYTDFDRRIVRNVNTKDEFLRLSLPAVFAVSGYHNSGKTWLVEKLINEFIHDGYTVGVIKHDGQDHISEAEGTDTDRCRRAGARITAVFSETQYLISGLLNEGNPRSGIPGVESDSAVAAGNGDGRRNPIPEDFPEPAPGFETHLIEEMLRSPAPPDIIILEGFKASKYPKVEVIRKAVGTQSVSDPSTLICIATDTLTPEDADCPIFGPDDIHGIFLCIKNYLAL